MRKSKVNDLFLVNPKAHRIIGRRAQSRRNSLLLSMNSVAKEIGVSPMSLQEFESGKSHLSPEQIDKLQSVLRLSPDEIYTGLLPAA